ncbi:MAG: M28 family peptidase [Clostridiales bacterium]|nr:M28 family peptidase [Clostridiales bacterium]
MQKKYLSLFLVIALVFSSGIGALGFSAAAGDVELAAMATKLETAVFKASSEDAGNAAAAKAKAAALVDGLLSGSGITATITDSSNAPAFIAAVAVDSTVQPSIDGKYKFTATLSDGVGTPVTTKELTLHITQKPDGCVLQETIEYLINVIGPRPSGTIAEYRACEYMKEQYEKIDGGDNVYEVVLEEYMFNWVPAKGLQMNPSNLTQYGYLFMNDHTQYGVIEADVPSGAAAIGNPYPNSASFRNFEGGLFYDFGNFANSTNSVTSTPAESDVIAAGGKVFGTLRFDRAVTGTMINNAIANIKAAYTSTVDVTGLFVARTDNTRSTSNPVGYTYNDTPLSVSSYTTTTTSVIGLTLVDLEKAKVAGEAGKISKIYRIDPEIGWMAYARKPAADPDNPDLVMVYQSHIDSVKGAPGATDTATGVAATLELARRFKDVDTGNIEIIFGATGAEEYHDFSASTTLIEKLRAEGKDVVTVDMMFDTPSSGEGAVNVLGDLVDTWAIGTLQFQERYQYPNYRNASYGDNLGTSTSAFNLAAHLLSSFAKEVDWPVGINNVRINNWGASDHASWAYFGIDACRPSSVARGGNFSISSSNVQVYGYKYHSALDNLDDYNYERHLKTTNLLANGIQKAVDFQLTKRAKLAIDDTDRTVTLYNAKQLWGAYDKVDVAFGNSTVTFTPGDPITQGIPAAVADLAVTRVTGSGAGISDNNDPAKNPTFTTKLFADYDLGSDADVVKASICADEESDIDKDVCYTLSIRDAKNLLAVEVEFEIDGNLLAGKDLVTMNGFTSVDGILWSYAGDGNWKGAVTIGYPAGGSSGFKTWDSVDIAEFVFAPRAVCDASMTLTSFKAVGLVDDVTQYIGARIEVGEATTNIDQRVFSKYDLNRDNKVDALDLGIMLLYCGFDKDSPNWDSLVKVNDSRGKGVTASMCDVNGDGVIDMLDLLDLFIHYTK